MNTKLKIAALLALLLQLSGCIMPDSIKDHQKFIAEHVLPNPDIQSGSVGDEEFSLHYRSNGEPVKAVAIWVHGTPGGWKDIGKLLIDQEFLSNVRLVSIDRPGWGASQFKLKPRLAPEFSEQSRLIGPLLEELKEQHPEVPLILVGHSWGGSLVPYLGAEHASLVDGVIVLAGGLDPRLVKPRWYNKAGRIVSRFLSEPMKAANAEVYALEGELTVMEKRWPELKDMPVIVVQGEEDSLVNPKNADFVSAKLDSSNSHVLKLPDQGHLLQIQRTDLIAKCIAAMADRLLTECQ